jgi:hypothetical protein
LIVVRNGEQLDPDLSFWAGAEQHLFTPLMKALTPQPAYPPRSVIQSVEWDAGPGETASFPTKWMSDDGRTLYLVFSGNDNFSVRRAHLRVAE